MRTILIATLVLFVFGCGRSPAPSAPVPPATQPAYVPDPPTPPAPPLAPVTIIRPDGSIEVPAGQPVEVTRKRAGQYQGPILSHNETAKAGGSNLDFAGEKINGELAQGAPKAGLGSLGVGSIQSGASTTEGSTTTAEFKIVGGSQNAIAGYAIGIILILAGAALCYFVGPKYGLPVVGLGVLALFLATIIDKYPWLLLVIGGLVIVGIGWIVYTTAKKAKEAEDKTLVSNTLVDAVDTHIEATGDDKILDSIRYEASGPDATKFKALVTGIKEDIGIKPKDPFIEKAHEAEAAAAPVVPAPAVKP